MSVNDIKTEFGPVIGQLLEYHYEAIPPRQRTPGQSAALTSARDWLTTILSGEFQPVGAVDEEFHLHDARSCDAVQMRYQAAGEFDIQVSQTIFIITITVNAAAPAPDWNPAQQDFVRQFAERMFQQTDRINLSLKHERNGTLLGRQVARPNIARSDIDWLDTLMWWSDRTSLGFAVLKRTGPDQAARTSTDLEPNQVWFRMFEQPRTR